MEARRNGMKSAFALLVGAVYVTFAALEMIQAIAPQLPLDERLMVPGDLMGGFVLAVTGAVFLYGFGEMRGGVERGAAYLYVGIMLGLVFSGVYLLILGTGALDAVVTGRIGNWTPAEGMRPALYLGPLPLAGFLAWREIFDLGRVRWGGGR